MRTMSLLSPTLSLRRGNGRKFPKGLFHGRHLEVLYLVHFMSDRDFILRSIWSKWEGRGSAFRRLGVHSQGSGPLSSSERMARGKSLPGRGAACPEPRRGRQMSPWRVWVPCGGRAGREASWPVGVRLWGASKTRQGFQIYILLVTRRQWWCFKSQPPSSEFFTLCSGLGGSPMSFQLLASLLSFNYIQNVLEHPTQIEKKGQGSAACEAGQPILSFQGTYYI